MQRSCRRQLSAFRRYTGMSSSRNHGDNTHTAACIKALDHNSNCVERSATNTLAKLKTTTTTTTTPRASAKPRCEKMMCCPLVALPVRYLSHPTHLPLADTVCRAGGPATCWSTFIRQTWSFARGSGAYFKRTFRSTRARGARRRLEAFDPHQNQFDSGSNATT